MTAGVQGLLISFGCLLTALFSVLIMQVKGMRDDLRSYINKQIQMDKEMAVMKSEHNNMKGEHEAMKLKIEGF